MTFFKKLNSTLNFTKKFNNSHEFSFMKKVLKHPKKSFRIAKAFVQSGGLTNPNTYRTIEHKIGDFRKHIHHIPYMNYLDKSLGKVQSVSKNIKEGLQKNKKLKNPLEKGQNVAETAYNIFGDLM